MSGCWADAVWRIAVSEGSYRYACSEHLVQSVWNLMRLTDTEAVTVEPVGPPPAGESGPRRCWGP